MPSAAVADEAGTLEAGERGDSPGLRCRRRIPAEWVQHRRGLDQSDHDDLAPEWTRAAVKAPVGERRRGTFGHDLVKTAASASRLPDRSPGARVRCAS